MTEEMQRVVDRIARTAGLAIKMVEIVADDKEVMSLRVEAARSAQRDIERLVGHLFALKNMREGENDG